MIFRLLKDWSPEGFQATNNAFEIIGNNVYFMTQMYRRAFYFLEPMRPCGFYFCQGLVALIF